MIRMGIDGKRLKALREAKGITPSHIANLLGISRQGYLKYETGHTKHPRKIEELAKYFHVSVDYLLGYTDVTPKCIEHIPRVSMDKTSLTTLSKSPLEVSSLSEQEIDLIKKYRILDARGQKTVKDTIERETNFSTAPLIKNEKAM